MMKRPRLFTIGTQIDLESSSGSNKEESFLKRRIKRQKQLTEYEKACPVGWKLDASAVARLRNPAYSDMVPGAVPSKLPPRMLPQHALQLITDLEEMKDPLITQNIAEQLGLQLNGCTETRQKINIVLLGNGKSIENVPYKWTLLRLFREKWRYKGSSILILMLNKYLWLLVEASHVYHVDEGEFEVTIKEANLLWPGYTCRKQIREASLFVLVVESLSEVEDLLDRFSLCYKELEANGACLPPFLCFTSFLQDSSTSGASEDIGSWLEAEEKEEIESCFQKANLKAGIQVISIKDYLNHLIQHLYESVFLKKWNSSAINKCQHDDLQEKPTKPDTLVDPFHKAARFLLRGLSFKRSS